MDSKLQKRAIWITILGVVFVLVMVLAVNWNAIRSMFGNMDILSENGTITETMNSNIQESQVENDYRSFLQDDNFFDKEIEPMTKVSRAPSLSLLVTSVEKDLRVEVLDEEGRLVKGIGFFITILNQGEYKDLDQDGIIYVAGLKPGEYEILLQPVEGYEVPRTFVKTTVKDKIEYSIIPDIRYLIKSEEEIDVAVEDSPREEEEIALDGTELKIEQIRNGEYKLGIDVSKYNKTIDWNKVKAAGIDFAVIRLGYRGYSSGQLVEDPYFRQNIEGAIAAGIEVGVYFFTQAINEMEAVEEASMVLELCKDYQLTYPMFIDTEASGGNGRADLLDKSTRTLVCKAFCETIASAGHKTGVYASKNWLLNNIDVKELEQYFIWLAEYKEEPTYQGKYHMWQKTSHGYVDGVPTRVDLNISYQKEQ